MRALFAVVASVAAMMPTMAWAQPTQGQTPENAQAFLTKVIAAGGVTVTAKSGGADYGIDPIGARAIRHPYGQVMAISAPINPCYTQVEVYAKYGFTTYNKDSRPRSRNPIFYLFFSITEVSGSDPNYDSIYRNGSGPISWLDVAKVEIVGAYVTLPMKSAYRGVRFHFPTEDLAKRVGFAMEVIRVACDKTSDANF